MAQIKNRRKRVVTLVAAAGLTVAGTGVAFAYWTALGDGEGTATTGESVAFVMTSDDAVGEPLSPGGPAQTVAFTVTNPGDATQLLSAVTVRVANDDGTTWVAVPGCSAADYTATISTAPTYGQVEGRADVDGIATVTMINSDANQDACQNADVPLYFAANPALPVLN